MMFSFAWCYAYGKPNIDALSNDGRTNFCPLVEIPPHGDLIDREAYAYPGDLVYEPVIIPADPAEEGE